MRRLLVNDMLSALPDHRTFWHDLMDWFGCEFFGGPYETLADNAYRNAVYKVADEPVSLIIRNASWFPPIKADIPTISLLQDIAESGPVRDMQDLVIGNHGVIVFNSEFTRSKYLPPDGEPFRWDADDVIPLPVDFDTFEPGNHMGLQQAYSLPDGAVIWVGASEGPAGAIKGHDTFIRIVRANPHIPFVGVYKDSMPEYAPPNLRMYTRLTHAELSRIIGACRVGLCTSVTESQHLAGIEMGACGLPLVVPNVGTYWNRAEMPGVIVEKPTVRDYSAAIRAMLAASGNPNPVRAYWKQEFEPEVVKAAWTKLVEEVESCSGQS